MVGKETGKLNCLIYEKKVAAMKQTKLDDSAEDRTKLQDKLQASEKKLPDPKTV